MNVMKHFRCPNKLYKEAHHFSKSLLGIGKQNNLKTTGLCRAQAYWRNGLYPDIWTSQHSETVGNKLEKIHCGYQLFFNFNWNGNFVFTLLFFISIVTRIWKDIVKIWALLLADMVLCKIILSYKFESWNLN